MFSDPIAEIERIMAEAGLVQQNIPTVGAPLADIERFMSGAGLVQQDTEVWDPLGTVMVLAREVAFLARDSVLALSPYLAQRVNEERAKVLLPGWMPVIRLDEPAADVRHFLRALKRLHDNL